MALIENYPVVNSEPVVQFEEVRTAVSAVAERFLTVRGTRVFYLGITCDTCAYLFEKRAYEYRLSPAEVARQLRIGRELLDPALLAAIGALLPTDTYGVVESLIKPEATAPCAANDYFANESIAYFGTDPTWGIPDTPRTPYWRAGQSILPVGSGEPRVRSTELGWRPPRNLFFHFLVPMEPPHVLDRDRVAFYRAMLERGEQPTAVGLSVLDVRATAVMGGFGEDPTLADAAQWCLATFLLDGHHKVQAAAEAGLPLRLLAFVARRPSVAGEADVSAVLHELAAWAG